MPSVSLSDLLLTCGLTPPDMKTTLISGLAYDSRLVKKGDLFFAMKGHHVDGHLFIREVEKKGAAAALVERPVPAGIPCFPVPSVLAAMSKVSTAFFGNPCERIPVIGITGTNGKTTITYLIEDLLQAAGKTCGVMGTVNYRIGSRSVPAPNTTPMSLDVQAFLADLVEANASAAVMEVSSHALELNRVEDVTYAVGVFTNLTQDHLDFHKDMETYFKAKMKLFQHGKSKKIVVNADDPYGVRLLDQFPEALGFGFSERASLRASRHSLNLKGIEFDLTFPSKKTHRIKTNLMGLHNISNGLAAAGAMLAFGLSEEQIVGGLNRNHAVPGRLERVEQGQHFVVVVDYAHTHDALEKVLTALRVTGPKHIRCVFGAGGDRDRTKRPRMGRVAVLLADFVYVTSDNPRSEDPLLIMREIEEGIKQANRSNYCLEVDREKAIEKAISDAVDGDIVLLAGKGHETVQIFNDKRVHFSDQETAVKAIKRKLNRL